MRVTAPGNLHFLPNGSVSVEGWSFELLRGETYPGIDSKACQRACLLAALGYIATQHGVDLCPENVVPVPPRILNTWRRQDLNAERAAGNVIARAKGRGEVEVKTRS